MFKLVLEKAEEPEIKLPMSTRSSKKQASSRKTSTSALLTTPKPLIVWITTNCGKFWKRWEYQTTFPASWETVCRSRSNWIRNNRLVPNWENSSGHRTGKGQFSFQFQRKAMPKNFQTIAQLHSSHPLAELCPKFSKPGFKSTWTVNFQMFKLNLEKEEPEIKLPT